MVGIHARTLQLSNEGIYLVYPLVMPLSSMLIETQCIYYLCHAAPSVCLLLKV